MRNIKKRIERFYEEQRILCKNRGPLSTRRGILHYGKPGTGKTSLINAISSELNRDLYFVNLKNIGSYDELSGVCQIPANQIIVLEDIDTQSLMFTNECWKMMMMLTKGNKGNDNKEQNGSFIDGLSLSTFLSCLDSHILSSGSIKIMTTNHLEVIDSACVRAGWIDLNLNLWYAAHHQIKKMYRSITEDSDVEFSEDIFLDVCYRLVRLVLYREKLR